VIKIDKPRRAPKVLLGKGKQKTKGSCDSYKRNKAAYDKGERDFKFDSNIYGHKTVKNALIRAQHDKCCFCESKITHISYGDVEHFRPKGGFRQGRKDVLGKPGYYWLAYEWSNLFLSCTLCNQRFKRNLFPLENPRKRAKSHFDNIDAEKPKFISPAEDAEKYIAFREEVAYAIDDDPRGKATIEELGLNRVELCDMRKRYFEMLQLVHETATRSFPKSLRKKAETQLAKSAQASSQYASIVRCAVKDDFKI